MKAKIDQRDKEVASIWWGNERWWINNYGYSLNTQAKFEICCSFRGCCIAHCWGSWQSLTVFCCNSSTGSSSQSKMEEAIWGPFQGRSSSWGSLHAFPSSERKQPLQTETQSLADVCQRVTLGELLQSCWCAVNPYPTSTAAQHQCKTSAGIRWVGKLGLII